MTAPALEPTVILDGIGTMIEDQKRYEEASAWCLLSIARSQERIADAAERIAEVADNNARNGLDVNLVQGGFR